MKPEPATETYLRRATRGLWGKKKLEIREELAAHLTERALVYQLGGMDEAGALERALSELGNPREVSLGMARLYTLPTVAGSGVLCAALCVLTLAAWPHTVAQGVKSVFYLPTKECVRALEPESQVPVFQACDLIPNDVWLKRQELVQTLRNQGVKVTGVKTLDLAFPDGQSVRVQAGGPGRPNRDIKPADPAYVSLWQLMLAAAAQKQFRVSVTGWDNPNVQLGDVAIQVGNNMRLVPGSTFYQAYLGGYVTSDLAKAAFKQPQPKALWLTPRTDTASGDYDVNKQALEVVAKPGEVYGVIALLDPTLPAQLAWGSGGPDIAFFANLSTLFATDVAQVGQGGTLELYLPEQPVRFVKSLGANPKPGTAVLVRLSGGGTQSGYEVVPPEQVRYQALKYKTQTP